MGVGFVFWRRVGGVPGWCAGVEVGVEMTRDALLTDNNRKRQRKGVTSRLSACHWLHVRAVL